MNNVFIRCHNAPSFVSEGKTFLSNPRFTITDDLESIFFDWEIKCLYELPEISLKIIKITSGNGMHAVNFSEYFIFPEEKIFAIIEAQKPQRSAVLKTRCVFKFKNNKEIPTGKFSAHIEMKFFDQTKIILQTFHLNK